MKIINEKNGVFMAKKTQVLVLNETPKEDPEIKDMLEPIGCSLVFASPKSDISPQVAENDFAAILVDIRKIDSDYEMMINNIKDEIKKSDTPLILITDHEDHFYALNAKFEKIILDYLKSPINPDHLRKKVSILCEQHQKKINDKKLNRLLIKNEMLTELVMQDCLTKIPNRLYFEKALKAHLDALFREKEKFGLIIIDIDHFKAINDTHGHDIGDEFLKEVVKRIESVIRPNDIFARLGGDEFSLIVEGVKRVRDVEVVADKILEIFQEAFYLSAADINATASLGIYFAADEKLSDKLVLKNADLALYLAKSAGRNQYKVYGSKFDREQKLNLKIESLLDSIDKNSEFSVVYQPIVDIQSGSVVSLEAFLRWKNREIGNIHPEKFIPLAEKTGRMHSVTAWVIDRVASELASWKSKDQRLVPAAINLSAKDLRSAILLDKFEEVIEKYDLSPKLFQVDFTEASLMKQHDSILKNLEALKKLGITVNVDNFGLGYSSLLRLTELPINTLKLSNTMLKKPDLLQGVLKFADTLNYNVIASGVETRSQLNLLRKINCRYAQGFYFSKPFSFLKLISGFKVKKQASGKTELIYH